MEGGRASTETKRPKPVSVWCWSGKMVKAQEMLPIAFRPCQTSPFPMSWGCPESPTKERSQQEDLPRASVHDHSTLVWALPMPGSSQGSPFLPWTLSYEKVLSWVS